MRARNVRARHGTNHRNAQRPSAIAALTSRTGRRTKYTACAHTGCAQPTTDAALCGARFPFHPRASFSTVPLSLCVDVSLATAATAELANDGPPESIRAHRHHSCKEWANGRESKSGYLSCFERKFFCTLSPFVGRVCRCLHPRRVLHLRPGNIVRTARGARRAHYK